VSVGYLNNKNKAVLNPFDGGLELQHDDLAGTTTRNQTLASFTIQAGFSRVHPNLEIPVGLEVDIEVGGELIVL
jgi:hypothetical protein